MIRNYETPEGTIALIDSISTTSPKLVFTSTTTGGPEAGGVTGRANAITTIALCNTAAPDPVDELANSVRVNIYVVRDGFVGVGSPTPVRTVPGNLIVSELTVPAGETVFFSEERMVLESGDEIWIGTSASGRLSVTVSTLAV
jgi:hypothetical protein